MRSKLLRLSIAFLLPATLVISGCSNSENSALSLTDSCAQLDGIATQLAEGIGKAQDDPANAKSHLDISRDALKNMVAINSEDESFNSATADYSDKLGSFLDALESAIASGGGLNDASVTPSRDAARTAGETLDSVCK